MSTTAIATSGPRLGLSLGDWQRLCHRMAALRRLWRRRRARKSYLAPILSETVDPRLLEDAGLRPLPRKSIEDWAWTVLCHQQH